MITFDNRYIELNLRGWVDNYPHLMFVLSQIDTGKWVASKVRLFSWIVSLLLYALGLAIRNVAYSWQRKKNSLGCRIIYAVLPVLTGVLMPLLVSRLFGHFKTTPYTYTNLCVVETVLVVCCKPPIKLSPWHTFRTEKSHHCSMFVLCATC